MNDEIKEKIKAYYVANDIDELLDYITNLQQIEQDHKKINGELREEINKLTAESTEWESKCYDLQQENERLKEDLKNSVSIDRFDNIQIEMQKDIDFKQNKIIELETKYKALFNKAIPEYQVSAMEDYIKSLEDYKSRCKKAVELIKEAGCYNEDMKSFNDDIWDELDDLLNILQNGSDKK